MGQGLKQRYGPPKNQRSKMRHSSRILRGSGSNHTALYRIPTVLLVSLFALSTLVAASYGMKNYQVIVKASDKNFVGRTGLSYIATKMRQTKAAVIELPDPHTLVLIEEIEEQYYATHISLRDGMLRESFGLYESQSLSQERNTSGQDWDNTDQNEVDFGESPSTTATFDTAITKAKGFSVAFITDDLIEISLEDDYGDVYKMLVYMPIKEVRR
ncbi:MAG: DUF4860 domain-containing protein [Peptococcaceae bacterium]|nr:DUF4860 domain-containing protein [Peptococcaceae bacterium]